MKGTQHAQMQGSQSKPTDTLNTGNWPWIIMAEGDGNSDGLARI